MALEGINSTLNVTLENIEFITGNFSGDPLELFLNINSMVYGGWLYFILLLILYIVLMLVFTLNQENPGFDQIINNLMYSGAIVTIISLFLRVIYFLKGGLQTALISDSQMWIFPVITLICALIVYMNKR